MLVYGDASRIVGVAKALDHLAVQVVLGLQADGFARRAALTEAFIIAAELAQGLIDVEFRSHGFDEDTPLSQAATGMLMGLAELMAGTASGAQRFSGTIETLRALNLPEQVSCARAEGYAFYALYPDAFLRAGAALRELPSPLVIGIRSIGLGLAALVAARASAAPPVSVRPIGHPFARELALGPSLGTTLGNPDQSYAVVDEGPGLSGSSFGAVLDRLEQARVPLGQINIFPSHAGDIGHEGSEAHRDRWSKVHRHVVSFEDIVLSPREPNEGLAHWFSDRLGEPLSPLVDLSGGAWRTTRYDEEADWPAANISGERRKYRLDTAAGQVLLKFTGLGHYGEAKRRPAEQLSAAGFTPEFIAIRYGFLAERWLGDTLPLQATFVERERLIERLSNYLAFRAHNLPATVEGGASLENLATMLLHNAREASITGANSDLEHLCREAPNLEARMHRILSDNRLHSWEWLVRSDATLIKTDAIDHAMAHDLVGCQDLAWDVAGAAAEFDFDDAELSALTDRLHHQNASIDPDLLRFLRPCYLAFQLGAFSMARDALSGIPAEAERLQAAIDRYRILLESVLAKTL